METKIFFLVMLIEIALIGGIFLLYPRIARKGLLFGVYVGEKASDGEEAHRITRSWYRGMLACLAGSLVLVAVLAFVFPHPVVAMAPLLLLMAGFFALYLQAYRRARAIAPIGPPPAAVAPMVEVPGPGFALPAFALAVGVGCGVLAVAYSWAHYADLPAQVPTHFGPSGAPDAWSAKSFYSVMLLPLLSLVMGVVLGGVTWLTANAKRALRRSDQGISLQAQLRFRRAMTRLLAFATVVTSAMTSLLSVYAIRVGLALDKRIPPGMLGLVILLVVVAVGGSIYVAIRYGQGGSRLERSTADSPLTDGLADNRNWVLGMFYVNKDDPSFLVEHRFGLGYTLNFGNWKAVALFVTFIGLILGMTVLAILKL